VVNLPETLVNTSAISRCGTHHIWGRGTPIADSVQMLGKEPAPFRSRFAGGGSGTGRLAARSLDGAPEGNMTARAGLEDNDDDDLAGLVDAIHACRLCAERFAATATRHAPRPVPWL